MKALLARIRSSEFLRNTAIVGSGTTIAQAITIFTAPVLTRIYLPTDYDVLGLYMMVTGLIGTLVTFQYHNVIITSPDLEEAGKALSLCIFISSGIALLTFLLSIVFFPWITGWFQNNSIKYWLLASPLSIFFAGWNLAFGSLAVRLKKFQVLTTNRVITALLVPIISITFGVLISGPIGLLIGLMSSQVIPSLLLSRHFFKEGSIRIKFNTTEFRQLGKKYGNFSKYTLPSEILNNFINQLPVIILATSYTGGGSIGNFNLSNRMLGMPTQLITNSVLDVFKQRSSQEFNARGNCLRAFTQTFKLLFFSGLLPFLSLMIFGPWIFSLVFGDDWKLAGSFASILAPFFFLKFLVSPLSYIYFIAGKQREDLFSQIVLVVLVVLSLAISRIFSDNFKYALIAYAIAYSMIYCLYLVRSYQFAKGNQAK